MKPQLVLSSVLVLGLSSIALPGFAQNTPPDVMPANRAAAGAGAGDGTTTTTTTTTTQTSGPSGPAASTDSDTPKKSTGSAAGYAYSDKPAASGSGKRYKTTGATVAMPGFEQTADGGSRFFVQLSQSVPVEERKANGTITYVMKGASPRVWNNTNALVTVHFSTPVARARLVPSGNDLLFVLDMRALASATYKITETADKGSQLTIDFPKGDWLNAPAIQQDTAAAPAAKKKKKK